MRLSSQRQGSFAILLIGSLIGGSWAMKISATMAADRAPASAVSSTDAAAQLLPQLGSDQFAVREAATKQLMEMGIEIKPALVGAMDDPDPEIRERVRRVLTTVVDRDFQFRLARFAEDVNDTKHYDLPGWSRFRKLTGSDRVARNLFVEMQRSEMKLMDAYGERNDTTAKILEVRVRAAQLAFRGRLGADGDTLPLGSVAALLFVGSDKTVKVSGECALQLTNLPYRKSFQQAIAGGQQSPLLKTILEGWVTRDEYPNLAYLNVYLAARFDLAAGLDPALRVLQQPTAAPQMKAIAMLVVARFGDKRHLSVIQPFLTVTDVCAPADVNGVNGVTQVRDVALFVSLRLVRQDPKEFGFTRAASIEQNLLTKGIFLQPVGLSFRTNNERDEAFKKWDDWRAAHVQAHDSGNRAPSKP
jgi:hypothetical protein